MDPRTKKLAKLLINYSLELKKGQLLRIQGEIATIPLMQAAFEEALAVGAHPYSEIMLPDQSEVLLKRGTDEQLKHMSRFSKIEMNELDALLVIWGSQNTKYLSGVNPERQVFRQKSKRQVFGNMLKRIASGSLKWVGTQFPTQADAQEARMSLSDYEDFVYEAGHINSANPVSHWKKVQKEQQRLVKILNRFDRIHVLGNNTDLKLRVKGRKWVSCHGDQNFPDGEIFTGPIENSAEGVISYSYPAVYSGHEVEGIRFEFKKGKVINESAARGKEFLTQMLNMDKGARYVGEFAIGTNYDIKKATRNTLFDEKIGGTCHLAVGASLPESGGVNKSALHWDMVCDLKKNSEITADGKVIYRNGKFTI